MIGILHFCLNYSLFRTSFVIIFLDEVKDEDDTDDDNNVNNEDEDGREVSIEDEQV